MIDEADAEMGLNIFPKGVRKDGFLGLKWWLVVVSDGDRNFKGVIDEMGLMGVNEFEKGV